MAKIIGAVVFASLVTSHWSFAQSVWTGANNNFWSDSTNWIPNNVPGDAANEDAVVNLGTPIVDNPFSPRDLSMGGGSLGASSGNVLNITRTFHWTGGTIGLNASVTVNGGVSDSGSPHNNGTINWNGTGSFNIYNGAVLTNAGRFLVNSDQTMGTVGIFPAGQLINSGTFQKSSGPGTTLVDITFNNSGTVVASSGTLRLNHGGHSGGTWSVASGATLVFSSGGAAPYVLDGTTALTINGNLINSGFLKAPASALTGNNLVMDASLAQELFITGDLAVSQIQWNRGVLSGLGTSTMAGKTFDFAWGVNRGRVLENSGVMTWTTGASWALGLVDPNVDFDNGLAGKIRNLAGANLLLGVNADLGRPLEPSLLIVENIGSMTVAANTTTNLYGALDNTGTATLGAGATLNITGGGTSSGSFQFGNGAQLLFGGTQTHTFSSSSIIKAATGESGLVTFNADQTNFAGTIDSTIDVQLGVDDLSAAVLNLQSTAQVNANSVTVAGGSLQVQNGATVTTPTLALNAGRAIIETGGSISTDSATVQSAGLLILNGGELTSPNPVQFSGSILGKGQINAALESLGGVFTPGVDLGETATIDFSGPLTLDSASIVGIDIDAEALTNDLLNVADLASLNSAFLFVTVAGNFSVLGPGDSFVIVDGTSVDGEFTIDFPFDGRVIAYDLNSIPIGDFQVVYTADQVILTNFVPEPGIGMLGLVLAGWTSLCRNRRPSRCGLSK